MSIAIDTKKCVGCMQCAKVCPGSLIKKGDNLKAFMKYPKDCWGCSSCIKECKFGAISLYLGADICGMGSKMQVTQTEDLIVWHIFKSDNTEEVIEINKKEANRY